MKLKKYLTLASLSALMITKSQAALPSQYSALEGFGLSFSLGYALGNNKVKRAYTDFLSPQFSASDHSDISGKSLTGGLDFSYGRVLKNCVYYGGEVFYNYAGAKGGMNDNQLQFAKNYTRLRYGNSFGAAIKVGGILLGALQYFKIGGAFTEIKAKSNLLLTGIHPGKSSKFNAGWLVGAGVEVPVRHNLSIGGEYIYSHYEKVSYTQLITGQNLNAKLRYSITPRLNLFLLKVKMKFGAKA